MPGLGRGVFVKDGVREGEDVGSDLTPTVRFVVCVLDKPSDKAWFERPCSGGTVLSVKCELVDAPLALPASEAEGDVADAVKDSPDDSVGISVGAGEVLVDDLEFKCEDASKDVTAVRVKEVVRGDGEAPKEGIVKTAESIFGEASVGFGLKLHRRKCGGRGLTSGISGERSESAACRG
jgi:hypothetical protein